jgi:gluconate/galactonate dehydratase
VWTVANAHSGVAIRSFVALESESVELPHWGDIIQGDGTFCQDDHYELTDKPGFGIELNEEVCRANLAAGSGYLE